jgi:hypothetical protein
LSVWETVVLVLCHNRYTIAQYTYLSKSGITPVTRPWGIAAGNYRGRLVVAVAGTDRRWGLDWCLVTAALAAVAGEQMGLVRVRMAALVLTVVGLAGHMTARVPERQNLRAVERLGLLVRRKMPVRLG